MRRFLLLVLLLPAAAPAAERTLTLDEAVRAARANHPAVRQARAQTDAARARADQARSFLFPQLNANASFQKGGSEDQDQNQNQTFQQPSTQWSGSLNASLLIWDFGRTTGGWDAAKASADPAVRAAVRGMRPVGPATLHRIRATLRKALNDAIRQQLISTNPAVHVELPSGRRPKPVVWTAEHVTRWAQTGQVPSPVMVWTPEQTGRFLDFAADDRLYPIYHLIAFRGLRRGEACGLHWADLDLTGHTLTVRWQLLQYGWETGLDDPKTDASADVIALDAATATVLGEHQQRQHAERLAAGPDWSDTGLVFTTLTGRPLHPADVTDHFTRLAAVAGLPPVRLHDLRHGAATLTLAAGADMKVVSQLLRHSSITITADTYTSVLPQVARDAAEKTAALVPRARARTLGPTSGAHQTTVDSQDHRKRSSKTTKDQVNNGVGPVSEGAPPGTRTPNPRIKSPIPPVSPCVIPV